MQLPMFLPSSPSVAAWHMIQLLCTNGSCLSTHFSKSSLLSEPLGKKPVIASSSSPWQCLMFSSTGFSLHLTRLAVSSHIHPATSPSPLLSRQRTSRHLYIPYGNTFLIYHSNNSHIHDASCLLLIPIRNTTYVTISKVWLLIPIESLQPSVSNMGEL